MTYAQKLKDPRWQKKRLEILKRDKWKCKLCDDKETTLHIHHKEYKPNTDPWDYSNDKLITHCENCHLIVEYFKRKDFSNIIKTMKIGRWIIVFSIDSQIGAFYITDGGLVDPLIVINQKEFEGLIKINKKNKKERLICQRDLQTQRNGKKCL